MTEQTTYTARLVRTLDPARPTAEAVLVRSGRVRAVGTLEELASYGDSRLDTSFADAVLMPGFVEAHAHIMSGGMWRNVYVGYYDRTSPDGRLWPGCTTLDAVLDRLRDADQKLDDPDQALMAWGLDPINFPGERLDRRHLDSVSSTRPVCVAHQSLHVMTVNTVLLRHGGVDGSCRVEGVVMAADGEPTGELQEPPAMGLMTSIPPLLRFDFDGEALWSFGADARNQGVTTLADLGCTFLTDDDDVASLRAIVDDPQFPARLSVFHMGGGLAGGGDPGAAAARLRHLRTTSSDKLQLGHVKLVLDGSIQGFTARLMEPGYLRGDAVGQWLIAPEQFRDLFSHFHRAGLTVHVHCNGDESTELFLETVEAELTEHPRPDHRHTVTHSQLTTPAQYRRMRALGMCANIFANHLWYWGDVHHDLTLGPDRAARMNAAATALRHQVPISLHSDSPVTPLDALATASYGASRTTPGGRVIGEHERISVADALHCMTLGAAFQLKLDHVVGSLEAGKHADFAVLDDDPFEVDAPEQLRELTVHGSVVGGCWFPAGG